MEQNNSNLVESSTIESSMVESSMSIIANLYELYSADVYMTTKLSTFISQQLPNLLEHMKSSRINSLQRIEEHTVEQKRFISTYLNKNKHFFHSSNEKLFSYDGKHYSEVSEDDILHDICSNISHDRNPLLMNWKHKTKVSVLKKIKENPLTKSIPESDTIQNVLQLFYSHICSTKAEAKFILTVLGDNILKKNTAHIHFISPSSKDFFKKLNLISIEMFNTQCNQTFKYKHHEKHFGQQSECRLIPTVENAQNHSWHRPTLEYSLDILCVAVHYSHKHGNSDDFLTNQDDVDLEKYVLWLKNQNPNEMVETFIKEYLIDYEKDDPVSIHSSPIEESFLLQHLPLWDEKDEKVLSWKEIHYLWRDFLNIHKLPQNLYNNLTKQIFVETMYPHKYDAQLDRFTDLGSSHIPVIQKFLKFWSDTTVEEVNNEIEIEETAQLFKRWSHNRGTNHKNNTLKESKILDILAYFHPELEIHENKFIYGVRNIMWDKGMDIDLAFGALKEVSNPVSIYDAYLFYFRFYKDKDIVKFKKMFVSKLYFEKYIRIRYPVDDLGYITI